MTEESLELIDTSRSQLIEREFRLVNGRRMAIETAGSHKNGGNVMLNSVGSATTPPQVTASSSYDPFRRGETKRRSITSSFSNIFKRPSNAGKIMVSYILFFFSVKLTAILLFVRAL